MNIEVTVSEVDLGAVIESDYEGRTTLADRVTADLVAQFMKTDSWPSLRERVTQIRDEEIRSLVVPAIREAFEQPISLTNTYGEATGKVATLREVIVAEARKVFTGRDRSSSYGDESIARKIIREEVGAAFKNELSAVIKEEREKVVAAVRAQAAELIADAVAKGVGR
jgi:hypothetical protein